MEETYYILQIIFIGILVAITAYYAIQTHRQADLLKRQLDESSHIHKVAARKQSIEQIYEWVQYGLNAYCMPGLGHCDRSKYPVSAEATSHFLLLGARALGNASYIGGDLLDKVNVALDSMDALLKSIKVDAELSRLSGSEYEHHIKDVQNALATLSEGLAAVMTECEVSKVKLDMET